MCKCNIKCPRDLYDGSSQTSFFLCPILKPLLFTFNHLEKLGVTFRAVCTTQENVDNSFYKGRIVVRVNKLAFYSKTENSELQLHWQVQHALFTHTFIPEPPTPGLLYLPEKARLLKELQRWATCLNSIQDSFLTVSPLGYSHGLRALKRPGQFTKAKRKPKCSKFRRVLTATTKPQDYFKHTSTEKPTS